MIYWEPQKLSCINTRNFLYLLFGLPKDNPQFS